MEVAPVHIEQILNELRQLREETSTLRAEVRNLRQAVRADTIRYRPADLAERLKVSRQHVYRLWNEHGLRYATDSRGRYSTEAHVAEFEMLNRLR